VGDTPRDGQSAWPPSCERHPKDKNLRRGDDSHTRAPWRSSSE